MSTITVKPVKDIPSCEHLIGVHRRIWTGAGGIEIIPTHVLITLAKNGGLVLGAYAGDGPAETGTMVGFIIGWLATIPETEGQGSRPKLKHCSHIAGVLPEWQGQGVGLKLKLAQREAVLAQGVVDYATWTYDPLYWVNGRMNIHRLGAVCSTYKRDVYGQMADDLNAGAPTDRCQVDWFLNSEHVKKAIDPDQPKREWDIRALQILSTTELGAGLRKPEPPSFNLQGAPIALPLPDDVAALRRGDNQLLADWRYFQREVFEAAFGAGYVLVDCIHIESRGWHYILAVGD